MFYVVFYRNYIMELLDGYEDLLYLTRPYFQQFEITLRDQVMPAYDKLYAIKR